MAGSPPNFHRMDSRSACIQGVLKVKVKVKGHVIRTFSWILGMSYSVIDGLVVILFYNSFCSCENSKFAFYKLSVYYNNFIVFFVHITVLRKRKTGKNIGKILPYLNGSQASSQFFFSVLHHCPSP